MIDITFLGPKTNGGNKNLHRFFWPMFTPPETNSQLLGGWMVEE